MGKVTDWNPIRLEYITTSITYKALAEKHGVPYKTLSNLAVQEKWKKSREEYNNKIVDRAAAKSGLKMADFRAKLYALAYKVASQLEETIDNYTPAEMATMGLKPRDLTGALKDLSDVMHIKSEADAREQEARIRKLRHDVESKNDNNKVVNVVFADDVKKYSE